MAICAQGSKGFRQVVPIGIALAVIVLVSFSASLLSAQEIPARIAPPEPAPAPVTSYSSDEPSPPLTPEQLGDLHMARQRYQAALADYNSVEVKTTSIWNKLGIASQQLFMLDNARKCYETALKIDKKDADVLNNLGTVYYSQKDYGNAERMYRRAIKIEPRSALFHKNLGTVLLAEDKFKKGWESYQAALAIDPQVFERKGLPRIGQPTNAIRRGAMNYFLAKSYAQAGMTDRAVEYLRLAIDEGFTDRKKVMADKELAVLHGTPGFNQLILEQSIQ